MSVTGNIASVRSVDPKLVGEMTDSGRTSPYTKSIYYVNSLDFEVTVVDRNNLPVTIRKISGGNVNDPCFAIRTSYTFRGRESIIQIINNLSSHFKHFGEANQDLSLISRAITDKMPKSAAVTCPREIQVTIERKIDLFELRAGNVTYDDNNDVVVYRGSYNPTVPHPHSVEGHNLNYYNKVVKDTRFSGIFVEVVDNDNDVNQRYMFAGKQVIPIPVKKDSSRKSGVYHTTVSCGDVNDISMAPEFSTLDEAESELGIYPNRESAISGGNPELLAKSRHSALEAELFSLKSENERAKEAARKAELERQAELDRIAHQRSLEKQEADRVANERQEEINRLKDELARKQAERSDYYDDRKYRRHDEYDRRKTERNETIETLKTIAVVVSAAISLAALINSANGKKS